MNWLRQLDDQQVPNFVGLIDIVSQVLGIAILVSGLIMLVKAHSYADTSNMTRWLLLLGVLIIGIGALIVALLIDYFQKLSGK